MSGPAYRLVRRVEVGHRNRTVESESVRYLRGEALFLLA
jgi:hypothetical protein